MACRLALTNAVLALALALPAAAQPLLLKPDVQPKLIPNTCGTAAYPKAAEQAGHEGTVLLRLAVSDQGAVLWAQVVESSKSAILDTESRFISAQCRFRPALKDGKAVPGEVSVPFVWKLQDPPSPPASAASGGAAG